MTPISTLAITIAIPLIGALLIALTGKRKNLREAVTLITAVSLLLWVINLLSTEQDWTQAMALLPLLPGVPLALHAEPLGLLFALIASSLWLLTSLYAIGYMRSNKEINQTRFYVCFAISISATMGIALAGNLLTLFLFYEALTLATYPLVTHKGNDKAKHGGRVYLGLLLSTSIGFFLLALIWTWVSTGTLDFTPGGIFTNADPSTPLSLLLILFLFGIGKASLMPFHRWLPAAMVAPTPVSALLHAVAVVKAGVFTVLKIAIYIFGLEQLREIPATQWMMWLAAASIVIASIIALRQDNLKARLAYSTVSQLSYVTMAALLANSIAATAGAVHIAMHAVGKITLFFCAGAIYTATRKTRVSELDGLGRIMPFTFGAFLIASLSIIGLPPMGGSWSKWFILLGAVEAEQLIAMIVLLVSSLLNIAYLLPISIRGFMVTTDKDYKINEAPMLCVVPLVITATGCVLLFLLADSIFNWIEPITR